MAWYRHGVVMAYRPVGMGQAWGRHAKAWHRHGTDIAQALQGLKRYSMTTGVPVCASFSRISNHWNISSDIPQASWNRV